MRVHADAGEVGVAVAQRGERHARGQALQRGERVGIELDAVAFGEEDLEGGLGVDRIVAGLAHRAFQGQPAHQAEVVGEVRVRGEEPSRSSRMRSIGNRCGGAAGSVVRSQACSAVLDPRPDRRERPQGVVEVEGDGADGERFTRQFYAAILGGPG